MEVFWAMLIYLIPLAKLFVFFFKQKTAYEISECDWSSDVCSSDLSYAVFCLTSEEHTSELQSHSEISYAGFCLKKKNRPRPPEGGMGSPRRRRRPGYRWRGSRRRSPRASRIFFFNDTATTEIYTNLNTLSLHDALPI